jgi:hypothetical protein
MAVVDLGSNDTFANQQTIALTCAASVAAGVLVVVFVDDFNGSGTGIAVTDSKGNTYTLALSNYTNGTGAINIAMFYSFITTPLTTSDTITFHAAATFGANGMGVTAVSATGYSTYNPATANSATSFGTTITITGAGSAAVVNEINFAWICANNATTITGVGTWNTGPPNGITGLTTEGAYQVNTGTSPLTCTATHTSQQWVAGIVSFQPSGGGGGGGGSVLGVIENDW